MLAGVTDHIDIIVSNPPYIPSAEIEALQPEIARYEPRLALDGGPDGLDAVRRLLGQANERLRAAGWLVLEIGAGQGAAVAGLAQAAMPGCRVTVDVDLAGLERYVMVETR
jgi:release factor glutamine methyltransferase